MSASRLTIETRAPASTTFLDQEALRSGTAAWTEVWV